MFKVGDRVRVVRLTEEDAVVDLRVGDTGTLIHKEPEHMSYIVEFDRELSVNGYDSVKRYRMLGWQIEKVEDKTMTRDDLENGMICILRDGTRFMWLNGKLRGINGWCGGTKDDLTGINKNNDIIAIYDPVTMTIEGMLRHDYSIETPIWERKEPKKMTVTEIEEALGYPVEVVK